MSEWQIIRLFLTGASYLSGNQNNEIFCRVPFFIRETGRFSHVEP